MCLASRPDLLLLDEPAAGLNTAEGATLAAFLRKLNAAGVTVVVVDHDMDFLLPLVARVIVLAEGRKLKEGKPTEVQADPEVIEVYLGSHAGMGDSGEELNVD
jgi:ABC-type branched-subunit amino acid transport system ATPase component